MGSTRKPAVAGQFYPALRDELRFMIEGYLDKAQKIQIPGKIKALIVPHAGYVYSGQTAAWGYRQLRQQDTSDPSTSSGLGKRQDKQHFVIIGPSHQYPFENLIADDHEVWETPLGQVRHRLPKKKKDLVQISGGPHQNEHCLEVQIPFLQVTSYKPHVTGFLTGIKVDIVGAAEYLRAEFPESTYIISTDLSHYLPMVQASKADMETVKAIERLDADYFLREGNTACGRWGVAIILAMARELSWGVQVIHYETSASAFGEAGRVVGYLSAALYEI
jgi:hypothetical protein